MILFLIKLFYFICSLFYFSYRFLQVSRFINQLLIFTYLHFGISPLPVNKNFQNFYFSLLLIFLCIFYIIFQFESQFALSQPNDIEDREDLFIDASEQLANRITNQNPQSFFMNPLALYKENISVNRIDLNMPEYLLKHKVDAFIDQTGLFFYWGLTIVYLNNADFENQIHNFLNLDVHNFYGNMEQISSFINDITPNVQNLNPERVVLLEGIFDIVDENLTHFISTFPMIDLPVSTDDDWEENLRIATNGWYCMDNLVDFISDNSDRLRDDTQLPTLGWAPSHEYYNEIQEKNINFNLKMVQLHSDAVLKKEFYDFQKMEQERYRYETTTFDESSD